MKRRPAALFAVLLAVIVPALAGCGEKTERLVPGSAQRLNLVLDYQVNPDHAGIYLAMRDGAFRRAGLDVHPIVPSDPAAPLKLVASGRADIAISYEPELLLARDRGLPLVAIGALVQKPLTSIMSVGRRGITRVGQLAGKTVGTAGIPYQSAYLTTVLRHAHVAPASVKEVNVGFGLIPVMLSHRVAATLGAFWNVEGVELRRAGHHPNIIRIDQAGVPTYDELIFVARSDELRTDAPVLRAFLHALGVAHRDLRRNPQAGVNALLAADGSLNRGDTAASVRATLPAFFPSDPSKPWGWLDPGQWAAYSRWMLQNGLVKRLPSPQALTDRFLPGQGL